MGSSGTGRISDYPGSGKNGAGSGGGGGGGSPPGGDDICGKAFAVRLEDIEHFDYYTNHTAVPPVGTVLRVTFKKRLVAETDTGEVVGAIPTSHNYLAGCLKRA
jgi:hypothetical protein